MNYKEFLRDKLIKRQKPNFKQISHQLQRSLKDLETAEANLKIDLIWSFTITYHSMLRAGRALMFSKGYLPTSKETHKTIVEFIRLILGDEYNDLISRFNRMRRMRHNFIYSSKNHITYNEVKSYVDTAKKLITQIILIVRKENPQKDLFWY